MRTAAEMDAEHPWLSAARAQLKRDVDAIMRGLSPETLLTCAACDFSTYHHRALVRHQTMRHPA